MSDCLRGHPNPDWMARWDWNRAGCYDAVGLARDAVSPNQQRLTEVFALWWYPACWTPEGEERMASISSIFPRNAPEIDARPTEGETLGWDVIGVYRGAFGFGCSPLTCNGGVFQEVHNLYALYPNLDAARAAASKIQQAPPEPATYLVVRVDRVSG